MTFSSLGPACCTSRLALKRTSGGKRLLRQRQSASCRSRPAAIDQTTSHLSGGNQQKVVLAQWLAMQPRMLILDEPTRGIDVGAKTELYERIVALAHAGLTILMVSSDLEEVLGLSDQVILMRDRCITAVLAREEISRETIGLMMSSEGTAA